MLNLFGYQWAVAELAGDERTVYANNNSLRNRRCRLIRLSKKPQCLNAITAQRETPS